MSALPLLALGGVGATVSLTEYWNRVTDASPVATRRTYYALRWTLAVGAVAATAAAGARFGPVVPTVDQFAVAYVGTFVALASSKAAIGYFELRSEDAVNPVLVVDSTLERAFFATAFVPQVALAFGLPALAFPDVPLAAGIITVAVVAFRYRAGGGALVAVQVGRTAVTLAAFWVVLQSSGAGVGTAVAAVASAHVAYVALAVSGRTFGGELSDTESQSS